MRMIPAIRSLLFVFIMLAMSAASFGQIGISITIGPPALPVYEQPLCPAEGYLWMPGYWAYGDDDYFWVPGTWVMAPEVGFLWTPGYWGWEGDRFIFNEGYWGPHVGFYGGIDYGYGYFGEGYEGGRWDNGRFFYNSSVNNVNITVIHNVYNTTVTKSTTVNRVSYNGGNGGINRRPTPQEEAVVHEKHIPPVAVQTQHVQAARGNPELRASANQGKPPVAATPKPGAFNDRAVVPAKQAGAPYKPANNRAPAQPQVNTPAAHPEGSAARPDRSEPKNQPESNRAEPNRPPATQPNNRPEANRPPTAQPEPKRNEPTQRSQTPPPSERSQPQPTSPPPAETKRPAQQEHPAQREAQKPDEKQKREEKKQDKQPKKDEPPQ